MKKWTCCILSVIMLIAFSYPNSKDVTLDADNTSVSVGENPVFTAIKGITEFFLGIRKSEGKEIIVDLTSVPSEEMLIEIKKIEPLEKPNIESESKPQQKMPTVLIYHTHTDEAYLKGNKNYLETSVGRSLDQNYNVVAVGDALKQALEDEGFTVIHDKTDNVSESFSNAYQKSYETIKQYIGSVDIYIDLHRDAYYGQDRNVVFSGEVYSHICFVVANGQNYSQKPNWQENYALALSLTEKVNSIVPNMANDIIFKSARYNQHVSTSSLLIEMGHEENDIEAVKRSAKIVAQAFAKVYNA